LGHALGGAIGGWLVGAPGAANTAAATRHVFASRLALFAALGVAPDLDLLFGTHSTYTHSIGAVALVALITWGASRPRDVRLAFACAAAWGSHLLLDWLGADSTPPLGITALWPFTREFYQSPVPVFMAISRRYWLPEFYAYNARAVFREILILGPAAWLAWTWTSRRRQHG
jgi:inner membrane protein